MTWTSPESLGKPDEVGFGSSRPPRGRWPGGRWPGGRRPRWPLILAGAAVIAVAAVLTLGRHPVKLLSAQSPVTITETGHRLLGVRGGWELLGYGPNRAVRVQLAQGRVTQTVVPALGSTGPFSFVAGPSQVVIRPWDVEPGFLVADGQAARPLPSVLGEGGETLPGPRAGEVWVQTRPRSLTLARLDGGRTGVSMRLPAGAWWLASPNDRGGVLLSGADEVLDVWPGGSRRIGGMLAAVGPTRWLTVSCDRPYRCADVVIDPATGTQRQLDGPPAALVPAASPGVITPDGATAAVFRVTVGGQATLQLVNLVTGADQQIAVPLSRSAVGAGTLAWSPDGRWLFVITKHGRLAAVNAATGHVEGLGVRLPWLSQIAIRPG
jgi:hypothetical protein